MRRGCLVCSLTPTEATEVFDLALPPAMLTWQSRKHGSLQVAVRGAVSIRVLKYLNRTEIWALHGLKESNNNEMVGLLIL